ncbi:MAG: hypothetical protein ACK5XN_13870, partial [Bacteroidota bacterium]
RKAGAVFHAAHAQRTSSEDMHLISVGGIAGIALIMLGFFRSPRMLALCGASIATGLAVGTACTVALFGEIHLLVLVFGASLMGEAADYSIQLTTAKIQAKARSGWEHAVLPALRMALLTSKAGYAAMCLAQLPFLAQMGFFALTGMLGAYSLVRFGGKMALGQGNPGQIPNAMHRMSERLSIFSKRLGWKSMAGASMIALLGVIISIKVTPIDDPAALITRPADLMQDERIIREATGSGYAQQFILINPAEGTDEACLGLAEQIIPTLLSMRDSGQIGDFATLARIIPSAARQDANLAAHREAIGNQSQKLQAMLGQLGLSAGELRMLPPKDDLSLDKFLESNAATPFRHLRVVADGKVAHLVTFY